MFPIWQKLIFLSSLILFFCIIIISVSSAEDSYIQQNNSSEDITLYVGLALITITSLIVIILLFRIFKHPTSPYASRYRKGPDFSSIFIVIILFCIIGVAVFTILNPTILFPPEQPPESPVQQPDIVEHQPTETQTPKRIDNNPKPTQTTLISTPTPVITVSTPKPTQTTLISTPTPVITVSTPKPTQTTLISTPTPVITVSTPQPTQTQLSVTLEQEAPKGQLSVKLSPPSSGEPFYQWGEIIKISGTNDAGNNTYLFITKYNDRYTNYVLSNGLFVSKSSGSLISQEDSTFDSAEVNSNHEWEYSWNTSSWLPIVTDQPAMVFTLFASSSPAGYPDVLSHPFTSVEKIQFSKGPITPPNLKPDPGSNEGGSF